MMLNDDSQIHVAPFICICTATYTLSLYFTKMQKMHLKFIHVVAFESQVDKINVSGPANRSTASGSAKFLSLSTT